MFFPSADAQDGSCASSQILEERPCGGDLPGDSRRRDIFGEKQTLSFQAPDSSELCANLAYPALVENIVLVGKKGC